MADFGLFSYQEEVVERALDGENIVIWLPTGGGKTRAAVYVAKKHLESTPQAKVVVLVNQVHLVHQHYTKEFKPHLGRDYTLVTVSGESEAKDFFGEVVESSDVVICTAEILYNALNNTEESKHVELSDITLLIVDECHHTKKETVYNKIMRRYVEKKLEREGPLPQILGLTASPGTGGAKIQKTAVEYILQFCANLDSAIVSTKHFEHELKEKVPRPVKTFDIVEDRPEDPFGNQLKQMMREIHEHMVVPPDFKLRECGTSDYEADVVGLEQQGVRENNRRLAQCALHLRQYNDALLVNDTLRMMDAFESLEDFYVAKSTRAIDETDNFLLQLFQNNHTQLRKLARDSRYENPKMAKLESVLLKQFSSASGSRGILFSKTRKSIHCLKDWVCTNTALQEAGVKAAIVTGAGNGVTYMTQYERNSAISLFRLGSLNLLISTTVAEEGLDIPECNLVVRYGLLTNEIAQQQASGRARAPDSKYSVVAAKGGKEERREIVNEFLGELTAKAIAEVQEMDKEEFRRKITELQKHGVITRRIEESCQNERRHRYPASSIQLLCRDCFRPVALGSDIRLIEGSQYVNVNPAFKSHYSLGVKVELPRSFSDWEPGRNVNCCHCGNKWGFEIKYKEVALLPNLAIKNFALKTPDGRMTVKKWKDICFGVDNFSFEQYCDDNVPDLLSDDDQSS